MIPPKSLIAILPVLLPLSSGAPIPAPAPVDGLSDISLPSQTNRGTTSSLSLSNLNLPENSVIQVSQGGRSNGASSNTGISNLHLTENTNGQSITGISNLHLTENTNRQSGVSNGQLPSTLRTNTVQQNQPTNANQMWDASRMSDFSDKSSTIHFDAENPSSKGSQNIVPGNSQQPSVKTPTFPHVTGQENSQGRPGGLLKATTFGGEKAGDSLSQGLKKAPTFGGEVDRPLQGVAKLSPIFGGSRPGHPFTGGPLFDTPSEASGVSNQGSQQKMSISFDKNSQGSWIQSQDNDLRQSNGGVVDSKIIPGGKQQFANIPANIQSEPPLRNSNNPSTKPSGNTNLNQNEAINSNAFLKKPSMPNEQPSTNQVQRLQSSSSKPGSNQETKEIKMVSRNGFLKFNEKKTDIPSNNIQKTTSMPVESTVNPAQKVSSVNNNASNLQKATSMNTNNNFMPNPNQPKPGFFANLFKKVGF